MQKVITEVDVLSEENVKNTIASYKSKHRSNR